MNRFDFDWRYVFRHTTLPLMTAIASVVVLVAGIWLHEQQLGRYSQFSDNRSAVHEDYDALIYRRRLIDRYHRRYQRFHDLGFVGRESRLDWVETLRTTTSELTLPRVAYAIEPQLRVVAPVRSIANETDDQIHVSRLELDIGLVHELDLLRFFDELQNNAPGLIKVDRCNLTWQVDDTESISAEANILASCSILIFSVITSDVLQGAT